MYDVSLCSMGTNMDVCKETSAYIFRLELV